MRTFRKKILEKLLKPAVLAYLRKDRHYTYKGIKVLVKKSVFHPAFFYSTKFILRSIKKMEFENKSVLELGAGSGLISLYLAKKGAKVTAVDINPSSVASIEAGKKLNGLTLDVYVSDLFSDIPQQFFDYIIINPPYYRGEAKTPEQQAWYAGKNLEYFDKLFATLGNYANKKSTVLMSLSEDCELEEIKAFASANQFSLQLYKKEKILGEKNYLFEIVK